MKFRTASGGKMEHYGEKRVSFMTEETKEVGGALGLGFQVSDVQKPLAAVWRIAEKGNIVQFGTRAEDNFIKNTVTGEKLAMKRKGLSYVLEVGFVKRVVEGAAPFHGRVGR